MSVDIDRLEPTAVLTQLEQHEVMDRRRIFTEVLKFLERAHLTSAASRHEILDASLGPDAFVSVMMPGKDHIDPVLDEQRLEQ